MNFQSLKYIVAIERFGSISKAASKLYVSQPYLSKVVREMEEEYHITIFTRGKSGIALTDSGRVFIDMAVRLLDNVEKFNQIFEQQEFNIIGLRLTTVPYSLVMNAYISTLKGLSDSKIRLYYKESNNYKIIQEVYANEADIGVINVTSRNVSMMENFLKMKHISYHFLMYMNIHLVVGEHHPLLKKQDSITLEDIYQYNFVMYASLDSPLGSDIQNSYNEVSSEQILDWNRFKQIVYVHNRACLHNILTQTDFIALGTAETQEQRKRYHIVSIQFPRQRKAEDTASYSQLWAIHLKDKTLPPLGEVFMSNLRKFCSGFEKYPEDYASVTQPALDEI